MFTRTLLTISFSLFYPFLPAAGRLFCILPGFGIVPGNVLAFENVSMEFPAPLLPELLPENVSRFSSSFYYNINKHQEKV